MCIQCDEHFTVSRQDNNRAPLFAVAGIGAKNGKLCLTRPAGLPIVFSGLVSLTVSFLFLYVLCVI